MPTTKDETIAALAAMGITPAVTEHAAATTVDEMLVRAPPPLLSPRALRCGLGRCLGLLSDTNDSHPRWRWRAWTAASARTC